ncbi:selenium cofactor biosynthesis protein YqeC [Haloimpatiens sp. FM7330]|uniref:selenium cofactor biosynthesis protein YqeC n=1 Tax=Haloimpatiens sp. FM7330 TaxID=3298610 RepID=UPI003632AF79
MKIKDLLDLKEGEIVSIVGAGGKTSFMFSLAKELREQGKVLVTTTTKIFVPQKEQYDFLAIGESNFNKVKLQKYKGIYVFGAHINLENKIIGLRYEMLQRQLTHFKYILIEADGSKGKPIKGWNEKEPVVWENTDKTVGILNIEALGKKINSHNVHREEQFIKLTNSRINDYININHLKCLIFNKNGLFKNSCGEKILFINKVEEENKKILARKLLKIIVEENNNYLDKIIIGSLKNQEYYLAFNSKNERCDTNT